MFITRKFGALLRGKTTPFQIYSAAILACVIAFNPGFAQAPGLLLVEIALLVLLNANLFVAGLVGVIAKVLYWLLLPILFHFGVGLVEGPTGGLFALLANAPVTAWFGFEYYVVPSGLLVGALLGLGVGYALCAQIRRIRQRLAGWEQDSAAFEKWSGKWYVKILAFVFLGGTKPKKSSWAELAQTQSKGLPVRPLGVALVIVSTVLLVMAFLFLDSLILTETTRSALERMNGATVDLAEVNLAPSEGKLTISGLAMADPNALETNLFAAETIVADVSGMSLLTRKVALDRITVSGAVSGEKRSVPGKLVTPAPEPVEPEPSTDPNSHDLNELLKNARVWKERLARVQGWIERFAPSDKEAAEEGGTEATETPEPTLGWREQLKQEAELKGYARVASPHLVRASPQFSVGVIEANGVRLTQLPGELLDVRAESLSTQPWLLDTAPHLEVKARSEKFGGVFTGGAYAQGGESNTLEFFVHQLTAAQIAALLSSPEKFPIRSGTFDLSGEGTLSGSALQLPVTTKLTDAEVAVAGMQPVKVPSMEIPLTIGGTIAAPRITIDPDSFQEALKNAAKGRLKEEATDRLRDAVGDKLPGGLPNIFGGGG